MPDNADVYKAESQTLDRGSYNNPAEQQGATQSTKRVEPTFDKRSTVEFDNNKTVSSKQPAAPETFSRQANTPPPSAHSSVRSDAGETVLDRQRRLKRLSMQKEALRKEEEQKAEHQKTIQRREEVEIAKNQYASNNANSDIVSSDNGKSTDNYFKPDNIQSQRTTLNNDKSSSDSIFSTKVTSQTKPTILDDPILPKKDTPQNPPIQDSSSSPTVLTDKVSSNANSLITRDSANLSNGLDEKNTFLLTDIVRFGDLSKKKHMLSGHTAHEIENSFEDLIDIYGGVASELPSDFYKDKDQTIKNWVNSNLPNIVEEQVQEEIRRISRYVLENKK